MKKGEDGDMGEKENDYATKQSPLLMRSSDHLSTFKLLNEINVTSTSTSEFECSSYFCGTSMGLPCGRQEDSENPNLMVTSTSSVAGRAIRFT